MKLWLGTHKTGWLGLSDVPLFVSRRWLTIRKRMPVAKTEWALDSGGFTELSMYGRWETNLGRYVNDVQRFEQEIGNLAWVAPQDWMCEPHMLEKTGRSVNEHQLLTVGNFLQLRQWLGELVIPVLQGWEQDDYLRCWDMYDDVGVDLEAEPLVGLGTVCRRQNTAEAGRIVRSLQPLRLHGFGVKTGGLESFGDVLESADSMAWSLRARNSFPLPGCPHKSCQNCRRFATRWHEQMTQRLGQQRLFAL